MIGDWVSMKEAMEQFSVSRSTIDNWRKKYLIKEARLARNLPLLLNVKDLAVAEADARKNNPIHR